ncbi:hypothetical protein BH20ACT20_BH20ACT20_01480 [soil metagenome]
MDTDKPNQPRTADPGTAEGGFPEPPGDSDDLPDRDRDPHHALNNPVGEPDPTEWPDPYEKREDPRDPPDPDGQPFGEEPHAPTGSISTSEPHPSQDLEARDRAAPPERDNLDD